MQYKEINWIAKPFKYYFDPLNTYSISIQLEQIPTERVERIKVDLNDQMMSGKEIYKWLNDMKKKLVQSNVEGVVYIYFKAKFINGPIY